ncbi:MAG: transcriptional repressor [Sciscionella sp.]|nr:transcriptional repressor [Sciscionella sp.]
MRLERQADDQAALQRTLHEHGLRCTPQRQLVLEAVRSMGHATPEQVCQHVRRTAPTVNITTIYRTLDLLEQVNLVRHTHLGHGAPTYSAHEHEHVHLVCHRCGRVDEVPRELLAELAGTLRAHCGFVLDASHLALSGTCADCSTGGSVTIEREDSTANCSKPEEDR